MKDDYEDKARAERAAIEELQAQLRPRLKDLPYEVPLILLTRPGRNDLLTEAARFLIRVMREVNAQVTLREYDLSRERSKSWNADRAPTLLLDPERKIQDRKYSNTGSFESFLSEPNEGGIKQYDAHRPFNDRAQAHRAYDCPYEKGVAAG
jgi:hypothetical protein